MHLTFTAHDLAAKALALAKRVWATLSLDLEAADVPQDGGRLENGGLVLDAAGHAVPVADTSGAGDAFAAVFLHCRLAGYDDRAALEFANPAAAISIRAFGAQAGLAARHEVEHFLGNRTHEGSDA